MGCSEELKCRPEGVRGGPGLHKGGPGRGLSGREHFTARAANCCKEDPPTPKEKKAGRSIPAGRGLPAPPLSPRRQQARDSWVSLTAAFSWGEIKRLGDVGTCWPQKPKQCLI